MNNNNATDWQKFRERALRQVQQRNCKVQIGVFHNVQDDGFGNPLYHGRHDSHRTFLTARSTTVEGNIRLTTLSSDHGGVVARSSVPDYVNKRSLRKILAIIIGTFCLGKILDYATESSNGDFLPLNTYHRSEYRVQPQNDLSGELNARLSYSGKPGS